MAWPEFAVPLTIHDLPPQETYIQIAASLKALQEAVDGVFARIEGAVESRRERLEELLQQIKRIEGKIETLGSSTHPLAVKATALYPQLDELRSWLPLFPGKHPKVFTLAADAPFDNLPEDSQRQEGDRVRGQDTAELFHFFKQAQALSATVSSEAGPTAIPETLSAATSLLQHGSSLLAFRSAAEDDAAARAAATSSALTLQKASSRRLQPDQAPRPQPLQQSFQYDEDVVSPEAPVIQTLPGLARPSPSMSSDGDAAQMGLKRLIVPGTTSSLTPQGSFQSARESMPSRTSSGIPGSAAQKEDEPAIQSSGAALESSLAGRGEESRYAGNEEQQNGVATDSRSSLAPQQSDVEQAALPGCQSEQPNEQAKSIDILSDKQRTTEANSATTSAEPHAESSQQRANRPSASGESRPRRIASSSSKDSRPQPQAAQNAQSGQQERSTSNRAPQDSKAPAPRSRKGLPPRSQPGSTGGSAEALDGQTGTGVQRRGGPSQRWPGAPVPPHEPQSPLEKQVDFGGLGLGDGSSDLEHSIMLRQRSLSSRNSLEDAAK
ncbi:g7951 [Coccomyxa viridis]|uniref:G7951 protein n=1 Tax=Coccomyxa viridis TaxID=1274662 RepID=A0ABP1FZ77_9CHLO